MSRQCAAQRRAALLEESSEASRAHLASCEACRELAEADHALALALRKLSAERRAPAPLREAVLRRAREAGAAAPARGFKWRYLVLPAALAVLLAVLPLWRLVAPSPVVGHADAELVAFLGKDHLKYRHRYDRAEISTSDPAELERWSASQLELAISVPRLPGMRLVGARRCNLLGRWAALVFLQTEDANELLSLFVFPPRRPQPPGEVDVELGGLSGRLLQTQGLDMLFWQRSGLTYALVGRVPQLHNQ